MKYLLSLLTIIFLWQPVAKAQDAHYWTEQFGNKSMLLGGNVIGSVDDLGATFYNPARLALQDDPTFLISAKAYQYSSLRVKDGVEKADLDQSVFGNAPTLAAGSFKVPFLPNHKFAYAFLSRQQMSYSLGMKSELQYEYTNSWPGEETLYVDFVTSKSISDEWMGGSWAYAINEKFSVGLSSFASVFNQKRVYQLFEDGMSNDSSEVASYERTRKKDLSATSLVFKLGASYEHKNLSVGLTVTTPYINLISSGKSEFDEVLAGFDLDEDGDNTNDSRLIKNSTSDIETKYRTPWSIGVGAAYDLGAVTIHASAEWFDKIDKYYMMVPEPFEAQKSPTTSRTLVVRDRLFDERSSVINWGVGVQFSILDKLKGYLSSSSDHSTLDQVSNNSLGLVTDNFENSIFSSNVYHYGGGFMLNLDKIEVTIGSVYSRGTQSIGKVVNLPGDDTNEAERVDVIWERWRFLVGFSLPFYKFG
ncbi:hypothetical protein [Reichenbachiella ulvae]|uniref:Long-chain fatty acid transport protein n=1 Tax=Reichenbachiella ulvae TaxID=2980104 RepID=A0ABT3CXH9_9BACT|nr:hypothetical protein [Reichenbachiella ulvae]MCV9388405.1 hypothetical protein [Reichenbachiella ulvae]